MAARRQPVQTVPEHFMQAGVGTPDGTDVAGRLEPLATAAPGLLTAVYRGVLATALEHGITTAERAGAWERSLQRDAQRFPTRPTLWPLLVRALASGRIGAAVQDAGAMLASPADAVARAGQGHD